MSERCQSCNYTLSDEQLEKIALLVSQKLTRNFYTRVGEGVVNYFIVIASALGGAIYVYLKSKGLIE
jgi:hypothetical protein